ncbi:uncharacterized protein FIBRA_03750 [Fibroporia radiculosa]|uniref:Uncharacterized protein n=1 Tax=Fibroporia radiculosa TaxID=599839 RepID=J4I9S8_9APHY|nr:uncharacterized protein FIBRA_03750 [Fibroporia radiculosa]CCM01686.1 predicted protein [Fibroporia radiculosa]
MPPSPAPSPRPSSIIPQIPPPSAALPTRPTTAAHAIYLRLPPIVNQSPPIILPHPSSSREIFTSTYSPTAIAALPSSPPVPLPGPHAQLPPLTAPTPSF